MAKISSDLEETIWNLKRQLLDIIDSATSAELTLFEQFGETNDTIPLLDELKNVSDRASPWFSRLSNFQLRIAEVQPTISADMLNLVYQSVERLQVEIPAMERSIQEVKNEWNLP
ncbi:hypothetical protein PJF56_14250 [Roseofilum sp. BLCC_M91]|uniref:Uncharacterized protein n=1 Tax=Roseofilum halophilum BLCC-M91 TaxID=3022259 RepID=A0ABT7BLF7_9CYAN|nr:hypothetical protein [Roseofilum halophilum]MDJ1180027.1 hypothetical protein [Roseofilum halophilum BLCC-M91]